MKAFYGTTWDDGADPDGLSTDATNDGLVTDHGYAPNVVASPLVPHTLNAGLSARVVQQIDTRSTIPLTIYRTALSGVVTLPSALRAFNLDPPPLAARMRADRRRHAGSGSTRRMHPAGAPPNPPDSAPARPASTIFGGSRFNGSRCTVIGTESVDEFRSYVVPGGPPQVYCGLGDDDQHRSGLRRRCVGWRGGHGPPARRRGQHSGLLRLGG